MINVCHIIPTSYLEKLPWLSHSKYHLVLAHQVLQDRKYVSFYRKQKNAFILMDNSAYELGEAMDDGLLFKAIRIMDPDEFVIPDVLYEKKKSIERYKRFMGKYDWKKGPRLMAVPQGKTLSEWTESYDYYQSKPEVTTLGIGQIYSTPTVFGQKIPDKFISGRHYIIDHLIKKGILNKDKTHHLLGTSIYSTLNELKELKKYRWIRSVDTAFAYLIVAKNYLFSEQSLRPLPTHINQLKKNIINKKWKEVYRNIFHQKYQFKSRYTLDFFEQYEVKYKKQILKNIICLNKAGE